jgi:uncharacterized protein YcfJ
MNHLKLSLGLGLTLTLTFLPSLRCHAQEYGRVLSTTPLVQQTAITRSVCNLEQITVPNRKSGAGALLGGIAGGAVGNQLGRGTGNVVATMIGIMGGAAIGNSIEGSSGAHVEQVQRCEPQTVLENKVVGYSVTYEFAGKQYTTQLPQAPGATIALQVTPIGATTFSYTPPVATPQESWRGSSNW